jgi:hypothetical protein
VRRERSEVKKEEKRERKRKEKEEKKKEMFTNDSLVNTVDLIMKD